MSDDLLALQNFTGVARLFPLPNLVLFPSIVQGLHIFEPRYRQLATHALGNDRLIAPVLLRPGWEAEYAGKPQVYHVACLGRIIAEQHLEDGRYNVQLRGLSRVRIVRELAAPELLYRTAEVELFSDIRIADVQDEAKLRQQLVQAVPPWIPVDEPAASVFRKLLQSNLSLGGICDVLGYALAIDLPTKQQLLESQEVSRRAHVLLRYLTTHTPPAGIEAEPVKFPPDFSLN